MPVLRAHVRAAGAGLALVAALAACGSSGLSVGQRVATVRVCASAVGDLHGVAALGGQLAGRTISLTQAQHALQPVIARLSALGAAHASLPVGGKLQALALAVHGTSTLSPADVNADLRSGQGIRTAAQDVLSACAEAAH